MQRNLNLLSVLKRAFFDDQINILPLATHGITTIRSYCGRPDIKPFREILDTRREEAQRSLLVQVQSEKSCGDLFEYCSDFGRVQNMFHYQTLKNVHYVLVEMASQPCAQELYHHSSHVDPSQAIPVVSPFLWFKMPTKKKKGEKITQPIENLHLFCPIECTDSQTLLKAIKNASTLSQQMKLLREGTEISELGTRLRFVTARQLELGLSGIFRDIYACPFGSSVNGFGKNGCDLDLVLVFPETSVKNSRLVFHAKSCAIDDRLQIQNHIECLGDLMVCFLPGCIGIKKITQARVPIIKYRQELTNLDCDVSLYHTSCLQMSEVLYLLGSLDVRVREMVMAVRAWAKAVGLTNPSPGRWISNFSLTLLVIFFLQQSSVKILPPLSRLKQTHFVMSSDEFREYSLKLQSQLNSNKISSGELLHKFFQFYSAFHFDALGVNLLTGKTVVKPDYSAMFIVNPVEPELNVSKNVSAEETERLCVEMRNAAWILESLNEDKAQGYQWGLGKLLEETNLTQSLNNATIRPRSRLIDVKSLFDG